MRRRELETDSMKRSMDRGEEHRRWLEAAGWKRSRSSSGVWVVAYGKPQAVPARKRHAGTLAVWDDHGELYHRGGEWMYLAQPYSMSENDVESLLDFVQEWELSLSVQPTATHNPDSCIGLFITRDPLGNPFAPSERRNSRQDGR